MMNTPDILKKIIARKKVEIAECKNNIPENQMLDVAYKNHNTNNFYQALKDKVDTKQNAIIAEIKKASPSKGVLRENFNPVEIAESYEKSGATCLSVVTNKDFFQGNNQHLIDVCEAISIPILHKEFIIDSYQIYESRTLGADCILLIAACLNDQQIEDFTMQAININMDVLIEIHNIEELERTLQLRLPMIGVNNRNLHTFDVSLETTIELMKEIKEDTLIITESGILTSNDVAFMNKHNIYSFLVGEAFMRQDNPGKALQKIFGKNK
ncbi:indole-3-glycerol phosphate synthase TrpC [Candidatus Vesicomyidisocius calyptogenae]|uniref:Indole-3-glycerol phosphate synthase n=1 Tax=Vesicomyosocius okutanii subsp. Calyptogena okutanii (strain HA) TaxID=412965 RepID=A5CW14_VESOH|nr:indole-3-glycerol phosphate synthase TrpC [Candidatus Vesicomyosocius okutanii]BAF61864.1 indole-3-glycerol phosphate synthase [Candidatus Vesicomyosocius okutanii]